MRVPLTLIAISLLAFLGTTAAFAQDGETMPPLPIGDQASWFPQNVYPAEAKRAYQQGKVAVKLSLDKNGKPTSCAVVLSSGFEALDSRTCELALANARFNPARDASGKAVASTYTSRNVVWRLDGDDNIIDLSNGPTNLTIVNVEYEVDARGRGVTCKGLGGSPQTPDPCAKFVPGAQLSPLLVSKVKPVSGKVTFTTVMRVDAER
jgi:TonB family protein